ncbi:MAG TPA: HD domain-containing phosphohydrolase [Acidimicrobiales bacterium]|nr:HD domain-containing phosphohydrolase [Acidimicrobiales bacterium]
MLYTSLLAWVGCHVDAYEQAKWFGDDQAVKREIRGVDLGKPVESAAFLARHIGAGKPLGERMRLGAGFLGEGWRATEDMFENHWRAAEALIERLGLGQVVRESVDQTFERWDGKGEPYGARGAEVLLPSRLVNLADVVEVFHAAGGVEAAVTVARARSGTQFDPDLVELFAAESERIFGELEAVSTWEAVIGAEPVLAADLTHLELDAALEAVADFVDLKSPYTLGHSRGVADLAGEAAAVAALAPAERTTVRRAALVHDLGRLGVSNAVWDKEGGLTPGETERVRLHPYLTGRVLASTPALAPLAEVAVQHHERLDGSGYPRGLAGDALGPPGRILAAADAYHAKTEHRPHRPAQGPEEVARALRGEVRAGRLDGDAVDAVLRAAGHRVRRRREWPAGLTAREVEVLRLVARGLSHRQIAQRLVISRKTASNHVEHIYAKTGVSNRAMASVFAMRHGLLGDDVDLEAPRP